MPSLIFNGVTYVISQTRFEATRELLARFAEGHTLGVAMSLTHDGARDHLFITAGVPITLVDDDSAPGYRSRWWDDDSAVVDS